MDNQSTESVISSAVFHLRAAADSLENAVGSNEFYRINVAARHVALAAFQIQAAELAA